MKLAGIWILLAGLAAALLLIPSPSLSHEESHDKTVFTKHFQETLFNVTEHANFSVEILLDDAEYSIPRQTVGIVVHDRHDGDAEGAELAITLKNLETGETTGGSFQITGTVPGLYIVSGLDLRRKGRWEFAITVRHRGTEDRATFLLPDALTDRVPKGRYTP